MHLQRWRSCDFFRVSDVCETQSWLEELVQLPAQVLYNLTDEWLHSYDLIMTAQETQPIPTNDPSMPVDKNSW